MKIIRLKSKNFEAPARLETLTVFMVVSLSLAMTGCFQPPPGSGVAPVTASPTPLTLTPAPGPMAVKIIFKADSGAINGSFDSSKIDTTTRIAIGTTLFPVDGTLNPIARGGPGSAGWPAWLTTIQVGMTGMGQPTAGDQTPECAKFSLTGDPLRSCNIGPGGIGATCNGPSGYYRVSEADCGGTVTPGNGTSTDPVFIRTTFSDQVANLAAHENIMAVLEYSASSLNPPSADPTACFTGSVFTPENTGCSDQTWKVYLKSLTNPSITNPFLMLVPPAYSYLRPIAPAGTGGGEAVGTGVASKQFFLPLASNPGLRLFQISRINAINNYKFNSALPICTTQSPLCLGMVLYSLTLYRM